MVMIMSGMFFDSKVFEADCKQFATIFATTVMELGVEEISKLTKNAIAEYYGEYPSPSPAGYIRIDNFKKSWDKYKMKSGGNYEGGVIVSSGLMGSYPKAGIGTSDIFSLDMFEGAHGVRGVYGPIVVSGSPYDKIAKIVNESLADEVADKAINVAKSKGNYTYL